MHIRQQELRGTKGELKLRVNWRHKIYEVQEWGTGQRTCEFIGKEQQKPRQHRAESQGWQKINNLPFCRAGRKPSPGAVLGPPISWALFQSLRGLAVWLGLWSGRYCLFNSHLQTFLTMRGGGFPASLSHASANTVEVERSGIWPNQHGRAKILFWKWKGKPELNINW